MKRLTAALLFGLLTLLTTDAVRSAAPKPPPPALSESMTAKDFTLRAISGHTLSLSRLRGRPALVVFFSLDDNLAAPILQEVQQLPAKFPELKLAVWAVERSNALDRKPIRVTEFAQAVRLALPVLVTGELPARDYSINSTLVLLDPQQRIDHVAQRLRPESLWAITKRLSVWAGESPMMTDWRPTLRTSHEQAFENRRPLPEVVNILRTLIPPKKVTVSADLTSIEDQFHGTALATVDEANKAWQSVLPEVTFERAATAGQANVRLRFVVQALDPTDETGLRTLCAYCRTLDDGTRTLALIPLGHGADGRRHDLPNLKHLVAAAIGYAMGLGLRADKTSVMHNNLHEPPVAGVLEPSMVDLANLRNVRGFMHFEIARLLFRIQRDAEAEKELALIPAETLFASSADELRKQAAGQQASMARLAVESGFVGHWWILGPLPGREAILKEDVIPTNAVPDFDKTFGFKGEPYRWRYFSLEGMNYTLDLQRLIGPKDDCAAYLYAEVASEVPRAVWFKLGSDDEIVVWVNGQKVHEKLSGRGVTIDEDQAPVQLQRGINSVMMRITNGGGGWGGCLRITDSAGIPLALPQRRPEVATVPAKAGQVTNGLIAHYALDETSGNEVKASAGPMGSLKGQSQRKPGKFAGAMQFEGAGFVDLGPSIAFDRTTPFSVSAWLYPTSDQGMTLIGRMDESNGHRGWDLQWVNGQFVVHLINKWEENALRVNTQRQFDLFD